MTTGGLWRRRWAAICALALALAAPPARPAAPPSLVSPAPGALLPRGLAAFEIAWTGGGPGPWEVRLAGPSGALTRASPAPRLRLLAADLAPLGAGPVDLEVCGAAAPCAAARFTVSDRPLPDDVLFRTVARRFDAGDSSEVRLLAPGDPPVLSAAHRCVGCHAYAAGRAAFNVRQGEDRRLFVFALDGGDARLVEARRLGEFSFLAWSPDGRTLALVVNSSGVLTARDQDVEPFDLFYRSGDLALYDTATRRIELVPGASEIGRVEDMPAFCPDGTLVYTTYAAQPAPPLASASLEAIAFRGGRPGPPRVLLAAAPGEFFYLPACSPDGRFVSFVRGDARRGVFARRDAEIWILPRAGGTPRRLAGGPGATASWHRWSSDGRWLLFASQQGDARTAVWLAAVQEDGTAAPPVRLAELPARKVNQPELVPAGLLGPRAERSFVEAFERSYSGEERP